MSGPLGRPAEHHDVVVVGCGFSGLGVAIQLQRHGVDYLVLERAGDIGGTWRDNDYPGCCCDIPSHVYSYSFELNPHWTRGFAAQREIQAYLQRTAARYRVLPQVRLRHELLDATWAESDRRWRIRTTAGDFTARFLISAAGPLSAPTIPELPGLPAFAGTVFHSARWDHEHDLTGGRVAVVGTGASAIQFVPQIQPMVGSLYVFQRTAPWVVPRFDHRIADWEHTALRRVPGLSRLVRGVLFGMSELRVVAFRRPALMRVLDRVARAHLARQVADPELRAQLTPGYVMGCKRILISDDYYPALTQPNVQLVTDGIAEVRERSVVTGRGRDIPVDTIILGTGFKVVDQPVAHRVRGADGRTLAEHWKTGMRAYKGTSVAGFPNLFLLLGPNTGLGHNSMIYMIESQIGYLMDALTELRRRGATRCEVRDQAERRFDAWVQAMMRGTVWTAGHCQSWYLDESGRNSTLWPTWSWRFRQLTRRFDPAAYLVGG